MGKCTSHTTPHIDDGQLVIPDIKHHHLALLLLKGNDKSPRMNNLVAHKDVIESS